MKQLIKNSFILLGATLVLANCGRKNFTQASSESSGGPVVSSEGTTQSPSTEVPPTTTTPPVTSNPPPTTTNPPPTTTTPVDTENPFTQDACISTIQWYDGYNWIPYVNDQDCIAKMKVLIQVQTDDITMMNFEIRHLTKEQLKSFKEQTPKLDKEFVKLFETQTTPIYAFYDGWINNI